MPLLRRSPIEAWCRRASASRLDHRARGVEVRQFTLERDGMRSRNSVVDRGEVAPVQARSPVEARPGGRLCVTDDAICPGGVGQSLEVRRSVLGQRRGARGADGGRVHQRRPGLSAEPVPGVEVERESRDLHGAPARQRAVLDRDVGFARLVAAQAGVEAEQQRRVTRDVAAHSLGGEAGAGEAAADLAQTGGGALQSSAPSPSSAATTASRRSSSSAARCMHTSMFSMTARSSRAMATGAG